MHRPRLYIFPASSPSYLQRLRVPMLLKVLLLAFSVLVFILLQSAMNAADQRVQIDAPPAYSRLSDTVTARLINNGNRRINFAEGRDLLTNYVVEGSAAPLQLQNDASPLAIATGDFDEDGTPDLVCSYGLSASGLITIHRGNVDSIYSNSVAANRRRAEGSFTDAPFLSSSLVIESPVSSDLISAGDFDADRHCDLVITRRGQSLLYFLRGDGKGNLRVEKSIDMFGAITAIATGEINRADSLADIVVGVTNGAGSRALVFQSPEGAMRAKAESFDLPVWASSFAMGELDGDYPMDLAIAAGRELIIVRGRDRNPINGNDDKEIETVKIDRRKFDFSLKSITIGDFIGDNRREFALLGDDGMIRALGDSKSRLNNKKAWSLARLKLEALASDRLMHATELISSRVSSLPGDALLVRDLSNSRVRIIEAKKDLKADKKNKDTTADNAPAELQLDNAAIAIMPMRLNQDAISDLIILESCKTAPVIVPSAVNLVFTVNSNGNNGDSAPGNGLCDAGGGNCTLRAAIEEANASAGPDSIEIGIGAGSVTLATATDLPPVTETLMINGTTQQGFAGNPIVELNGTGLNQGFLINGANCVIRGFVINRFTMAGIVLHSDGNLIESNFIGTNLIATTDLGNAAGILINQGASNNVIGGTNAGVRNVISGNDISGIVMFNPGTTGNRIQSNLIGTNLTGTVALGNFRGVTILGNASNNTVGGTSITARNIISGNVDDGIRIVDLGTTGNLVQGNFIGTDVGGTGDLGNIKGVHILGGARGNSVGGVAADAGNSIAFNNLNGVQVADGTGNAILSNSIFSNDSIGINLGDDAVTANDPGDSDNGPNNRQNFPDIVLAQTSGSAVVIQGTLDTTSGAGFRLQFFSSASCDLSGNGEGERFLGSTVIDNLGIGVAAFSVVLPVSVTVGEVITATATDAVGNTSEFSACVAATPLICAIDCPPDRTFFIDPTSSECGVTFNYAPATVGACGSFTCIPPSGTSFGVGTTQVNCQTEVGPSCSFAVTVIDNTAPTIVCPEGVSAVPPSEQQTAIVNYPAPTVTDTCAASLVNCTPPSGTAFPLGETFVNCVARDDSSNESSCLFAVVVRERSPLTVICPSPLTIDIPSGQISSVVNYPPPVVSGNPSGVNVTCAPPSGAAFPLGATTVTCVAVDEAQNSASCSFTVTVNGGALNVRVVIEGGEPQIEFGDDTPVNPTRRPPRQPGPCGLFTIENAGRARITLTFAEVMRTGTAVDRGRITNVNEGNLYALSIINSNGSEEELLIGNTVTLDIGQTVRFCLRFTPLFPRVLTNNQNVPATAVMPDLVTSIVRFNIAGESSLFINVNGRVDRRVQLINSDDPRQSPIVKFSRSGDEIAVTYSLYDPNLNVIDATYEMLNSAGQVVDTVTVNLASVIDTTDLIRGQSFTVVQRFTGAQSRQEIVKCRLTVRDGETSVTRVSQSASAAQISTLKLRKSVSAIVPRKIMLTQPVK